MAAATAAASVAIPKTEQNARVSLGVAPVLRKIRIRR